MTKEEAEEAIREYGRKDAEIMYKLYQRRIKRLPFYAALMATVSLEAIAVALLPLTKAQLEYWYGPLPELKD